MLHVDVVAEKRKLYNAKKRLSPCKPSHQKLLLCDDKLLLLLGRWWYHGIRDVSYAREPCMQRRQKPETLL
jgi:hypothetical protein